MEKQKQQFQFQAKLFETVSGVMGGTRQHRQEVASRPTRQLSDELKGLGILVKLVNCTAHKCRLTIVIFLPVGKMM